MNHIPIPIMNKNKANDSDNDKQDSISSNIEKLNENYDCQQQKHQLNNYNEENDTITSLFPNVLPQHRQGQRHDTIDSYHVAIQYNDNYKSNNYNKSKQYTLVLITVPNETELSVSSSSSSINNNNNNNTISGGSILLGLNQRGFGKGFYNSFGGKIEPYEYELQLQAQNNQEQNNQEQNNNNNINNNNNNTTNVVVVPTTNATSKYNASISAVREVLEETGIVVPIHTMIQSYLGILNFTFDNDTDTDLTTNATTDNDIDNSNNNITEMIVHLFLLKCCYLTDATKVSNTNNNTVSNNNTNYLLIDPTMIHGCDEITTEWYNDWYTIPLQQMFIDDSIWLTRILLYYNTIQSLNGSFHFASGGTQTNTILHYYLSINTTSNNSNSNHQYHNNQIQKVQVDGNMLDTNTSTTYTSTTIPFCQVISTPANNDCNSNIDNNSTAATASEIQNATRSTTMSLERHLFHTIHNNKVRSPTIKEFNECYEFCKVVKSFYITNNDKKKKNSMNTSSNPTLNTSNHTTTTTTNNDNNNNKLKLIIDVAGGHGALAALLLITIPTVEKGIVIDPAIITNGKHGIQSAWGHLFDTTKLQYQHECLRTALPRLLQSLLVLTEIDTNSTTTTGNYNKNNNIIKTTATDIGTHELLVPEVTATSTNVAVAAANCTGSSTNTTKLYPNEILVVACHACQHLSDETIEICSKYNVHVAVLPCCQKDITNGNQWKHFCSNISTGNNVSTGSNRNSCYTTTTTKRRQLLPVVQQQQSISIATTMDLLLAGKAMSWLTPYTDVRIKIINEKITPQNRLILCRSSYSSNDNCTTTADRLTTINCKKNDKKIKQHERLQVAYNKAHMVQSVPVPVPLLVKANKKRASTTTNTSVILKMLTAKNLNTPLQKLKVDSIRTEKQRKQILVHDNFRYVLIILLVGFLFGIGTSILFLVLFPSSLLSFCMHGIHLNSQQQNCY